MAEKKSGLGLPKNTASALSYVLGPITGVVFLVLEKDPSVRFHAMQSIVTLGGLMVLSWIVPLLGFIFIPISGLLALLIFVLWLVLIYKAWQGEDWEVPVVGEFAKKWVKKV